MQIKAKLEEINLLYSENNQDNCHYRNQMVSLIVLFKELLKGNLVTDQIILKKTNNKTTFYRFVIYEALAIN